jgi:hypothetical protein
MDACNFSPPGSPSQILSVCDIVHWQHYRAGYARNQGYCTRLHYPICYFGGFNSGEVSPLSSSSRELEH